MVMNKNKRVVKKEFKGKEGQKVYSVATGHINVLRKASRAACKIMDSQEGFLAIHPCDRGTLWFYDSLNAAKGARNVARAHGIQCGDNICEFEFKNGSFVLQKEQ